MSENREKLLKDIQEQGDLVRKLKAAKESAEKVCVSVERFRKTQFDCERVCTAMKAICRRKKTLRLEQDASQAKLPHAK